MRDLDLFFVDRLLCYVKQFFNIQIPRCCTPTPAPCILRTLTFPELTAQMSHCVQSRHRVKVPGSNLDRNLTTVTGGRGGWWFSSDPSFKFSVCFLAYYAWPRTYPSRSCKRNPWRQHVHRATRRRSQAIDMAWRHVVLATTTISA